MKVLKYLGQILLSLVYAPIYTSIVYFAIAFPIMWILSLSAFKMVLAIIFLGGIIELLINLLLVYGFIPFYWIVRRNKIALGISAAICLLLPSYYIYLLWQTCSDYGVWGIIAAVILSACLLHFIFASLACLFAMYKEGDEEV